MKKRLLSFLLFISLLFSLCSCFTTPKSPVTIPEITQSAFSYEDIPSYSSSPYVEVNGNIPFFTKDDITTVSFESYSQLDMLGRCGAAYACLGQDLMPTEDRGNISGIKPSGWQISKYDFIDGQYLYNRCHLIAFCLAGENANEKNLITGTRYMNATGMLPFENMVADYIDETNNHVMYRVTPIFVGVEPIARGVLMEAYSCEDSGEGICFCVFMYNVQPRVNIDYATGNNKLSDLNADSEKEADYVLNTNTKKYHLPTCQSVADMNPKNKENFNGDKKTLSDMGYEPCGSCKP